MVQRPGTWIAARSGFSAALLACPFAAPCLARGTAAGTVIDSVAAASYRENGTPVVISSNIASLRVQKVLDVVVEADSGEQPASSPGATDRPQPFRITNAGNGRERFVLSVHGGEGRGDFVPVCSRILLDDGNGVRDSGDWPYVPGSNDPEIGPDGSVTAFPICEVPGAAGDGHVGYVVFEARAKTLDLASTDGRGGPGAIFADPAGTGIDAIVGPTAARASATSAVRVAAATPWLRKSQHVSDPSGGTSPVPGAVITYMVEAGIGAGAADDAVFADAVPDGTVYQPGSLAVAVGAGAFTPLTGADDSDAGRFDGRGVEVRLGRISAGDAPRTIRFSVRIGSR